MVGVAFICCTFVAKIKCHVPTTSTNPLPFTSEHKPEDTSHDTKRLCALLPPACLSRGGFRGATRPAPPPLFLLVQTFYSPIFALMPIPVSNQFIYRSKMSIVCVYVTVKTEFDNISTCK